MKLRRLKRQDAAVWAAIALCTAATVLYDAAPHVQGSIQERDMLPEPVSEMTVFYGSFDQLALVRYYRLDAVPEKPDSLERDILVDRRPYRLNAIDGPVETEHGACWEALYMEVEEKWQNRNFMQ